MNILQLKQTIEKQEVICKIHNLELIAVDMDLSNKSCVQFFCNKCLVDQMNNNKVTTIEQSNQRIQEMKVQQQEIKTKENQARLNYYKNILEHIMNFKRFIDDSLEKMYKQIQQYMFPIQKEKQELQDYEQQQNYFEDIQQLAELYSQDQYKSSKLQEDNNFIDEIQRQFELLFNCSDYFQTLDVFKNTREQIKDIMQNNTIELLPLQQKNKIEFKTPSLNKICQNHKKEIVLIDMDSQNKRTEDRFFCIDCIVENPQAKCQTIENVNKQWREQNQKNEKILKELKTENKNRISELFNQIALMRKNYNKKLNEINDKLISEQFLCTEKIKELNQIKIISISALDDEQLLNELKLLIEKEIEKVSLNQIIINLKNKDSIFKNDIKYHLESLKQNDQQEIQQTLQILKEISSIILVKFNSRRQYHIEII